MYSSILYHLTCSHKLSGFIHVMLFSCTALQKMPWRPPNGTVPLYYESYNTIFNDSALRNRLIDHIGRETYENFTAPITFIVETPTDPVPSANALLTGPGCQIRPLPTRYPNISSTAVINAGLLDILVCNPSFFIGTLIPYYFPPHIVQTTCDNQIGATT